MRPVSGSVILILNPSLQMTLTDDYAAGNADADKSRVDERYRLWVLKKYASGTAFSAASAAAKFFFSLFG